MNPCPLLRDALPRFSSSLRQSSSSLRPSILSPASPSVSPSHVVVVSPSLGLHLLSANHRVSLRFASTDFKSAYSIDKIYPGCSAADVANLVHHEFAKQYSVEVREKFTGYIPSEALEIRAMRSSGPGGQSVNTSNTKIEIRFNVEQAHWIPLWIKKQFILDQKHRINKRNEFIISSEKTRSQLLNQADCLDRIRHYIREAEVTATPKEVDPEEEALKKRREEKANERRLMDKKRHSQKKSGRGPL